MNYPKYKYYLINPELGRYLLQFEPLNWNEDDKKLIRNEDSWGVFTELSSDLQFVKDGKEYIQQVYETLGTEAEIILERYVYQTTGNGYELDYKGYLDLKTYSLEDEKVSIQFLTGGLQSLIESQFDEEYELNRGTDIDGKQITQFTPDTIEWAGRRIFLESKVETPEETTNFEVFNVQGNAQIAGFPFQVNQVFQSEGLPINSVFQNQQINLTPYSSSYQSQGVERPNAGGLVYINSTDLPQTFNAKSIFKFYFNVQSFGGEPTFLDAVEKYLLVLALVKYEDDGTQFNFVERIDLTSSSNWYQGLTGLGQTGIFQGETINFEVTVEPDEALALTPYFLYTSGTSPNVNDQITVNFFNYEADLKLEQDSFFKATEFKAIKLYDAFNRNLEILTGEQNRVVSDYFQNGQFKNVLLTSGKTIRNIPDARIAVSLKDLYETNNYFNLGWSVETIGNKEFYRVESKDYFFQPTVVIDLGEVSKLKISAKPDLLFKSMTFGNKKAGDYEEVQGLQEYNAQTTYVSYLKTSDTKYEVDGKIRADLVGAELARRKDYSVAPNEDTRYDNENFIINCKPTQDSKFTPKVWQDVLASEPFVYDPPTAGNLLLTPFRSMERHSKVFKAGLGLYDIEFVRYSRGTGKVDVETQLFNEPVRAEDGNIQNSELAEEYFNAITYEFEKPLTLAIKQALKGKTNDIPNVNYLIQFNYKGQVFYGYILEVGFNNPGNWKLLKANTETRGEQLPNPFYIAENGVTVKLKDGYEAGTTGQADGDASNKTYLAVNQTMFDALDPATDDYTNICTTLVTDMTGAFESASTFNQNISHFDTSNVTSLQRTFRDATIFNQPIQYWDVSNVTDMSNTFNDADAFNQPIGIWDVSKVLTFSGCFNNNGIFNQPLNDWDVSSATNMSSMFRNLLLFNQPLNNWNTSNVTNMDNMFFIASAFQQDLSMWCVENIPSEPTNFGNTWLNANPSNKPNFGDTC